MMTVLGSTISATSPWLLLAAPIALGLLVYIFRVRGNSNTTVVSSLFLLKDLPQQPQGRRTFVPPLQFWIELALFVSLALAAANLIVTKRGRHVAVLLDSSISMGAASSQGARLASAKDRATRDIESSPTSTSFTVFSGSTNLEKLSPEPSEAHDALEQIAQLQLSEGRDSLQEQIVQILNDPSFDALWVYTDHPFDTRPQNPRLIVSSSHEPARVEHNVWIQEISRSPAPGTDRLVARVKSTLSSTIDILLTTECSIGLSTQELPPISARVVSMESTTISVSSLPTNWDYCRLRISLPRAPHTESLLIDNEAWITKEQSLSRVTLQSSLTPEQLGLTKIPLIEISPANGTSAPKGPVIVHRQSLGTTPTSPSLLVMPPSGTLPWGGEVQDSGATTIARWEESHPIMRYVKPALLSVPEARTLRCPESAKPILFSEIGPLLCAGESRGARYVISGIELFPFDGAKTPTLSILLLNALNWLFSRDGGGSTHALPMIITLPQEATSVDYVAPLKESVTMTPLKTVTAEHAGVLKITKMNGDPLFIALNSLYDSESDLLHPAPITLQEVAQPEPHARSERARVLYPWFLTLALLAAFVDSMRRLRRRRKWGSA